MVDKKKHYFFNILLGNLVEDSEIYLNKAFEKMRKFFLRHLLKMIVCNRLLVCGDALGDVKLQVGAFLRDLNKKEASQTKHTKYLLDKLRLPNPKQDPC